MRSRWSWVISPTLIAPRGWSRARRSFSICAVAVAIPVFLSCPGPLRGDKLRRHLESLGGGPPIMAWQGLFTPPPAKPTAPPNIPQLTRPTLEGRLPHAASKIGADKLADSYYLSFGVPVVTLRPFNTFGPRRSARAIIPTIISQGLSGNTIRLGLLTPIRVLNFVSDTVEGFIKGAECPQAIGVFVQHRIRASHNHRRTGPQDSRPSWGQPENHCRGRAGAPRSQRGHGASLQLWQGSSSPGLGTQGQPGGGLGPDGGLYPGPSAAL